MMRASLPAALVALALTALPAPAAPRCCVDYAEGDKLGRMDAGRMDEVSGLAASRNHPGVLWMRNDSGDKHRIFAVTEDGDFLGQWKILGADHVDWEDMRHAPCGADLPGDDTEDNGKAAVPADRLHVLLPYALGADVEALFVAPDATLYLATKWRWGWSCFDCPPSGPTPTWFAPSTGRRRPSHWPARRRARPSATIPTVWGPTPPARTT